jgi:hypothetical protein
MAAGGCARLVITYETPMTCLMQFHEGPSPSAMGDGLFMQAFFPKNIIRMILVTPPLHLTLNNVLMSMLSKIVAISMLNIK